MNFSTPLDYIKEAAEATLKQLHLVDAIKDLEIPGRFVFSPPTSSRLCVRSLKEFHEARTILRREFGWTDHINSKFYSSGEIIVTYKPSADVKLPIPFDLWVESPPESFPTELLDGCILQETGTKNYTIVCQID